ncbi:Gfo/Idh/MocA family protein [Maridesulfovibrio salexigens]|uniref:Gfo/Idh/MocA family protein n=1 Tax=Maridesulfovibrio salexigens TaxID=880 RepID=UPI0002EEC0CC|nr:Gfo/Idh/MocA family oxidoreductase [Maridesulfovibrio salexigens]
MRIGVLGTASIAVRSVIPALLGLEGDYELAGIASRNKDSVTEIAGQFNCNYFVGYDSLLTEKGLDAVYIPLPPSLHYKYAKKALLRGLHVLVEKPLACSLAETSELVDLARKNKLVILENFQFQRHSQLKTILDLVADGRIGDLRCVRSSFGFPPFKDAENIRYQKELGGGALLDAGAYPTKISQFFLGDDVSVGSARLFFDPQRGVDTWGGAFIKQNNGPLFSEIAFGFDHHYQCSLELWGSKGKLFTNRIFTAPPRVKPVIELSTSAGTELIELPADDHFKNMLMHFHRLTAECSEGLEIVYRESVTQARLLQEIREKNIND